MSVAYSVGKRIIIIGSSNSGKSTLGTQVAERLDVPFIELDALHWEPNWVSAERDVFRERVRQAIEPDSWVIAGNYTRMQQDVSWPVADTVVWLDIDLHIVLYRCTVRSWQRWRSQEMLWGTNRENFWKHLMLWDTEESLIAYILKTHRTQRRTFTAHASDPRWSHITFIRLRSSAEIEGWLNSLPAKQAVPEDGVPIQG